MGHHLPGVEPASISNKDYWTSTSSSTFILDHLPTLLLSSIHRPCKICECDYYAPETDGNQFRKSLRLSIWDQLLVPPPSPLFQDLMKPWQKIPTPWQLYKPRHTCTLHNTQLYNQTSRPRDHKSHMAVSTTTEGRGRVTGGHLPPPPQRTRVVQIPIVTTCLTCTLWPVPKT